MCGLSVQKARCVSRGRPGFRSTLGDDLVPQRAQLRGVLGAQDGVRLALAPRGRAAQGRRRRQQLLHALQAGVLGQVADALDRLRERAVVDQPGRAVGHLLEHLGQLREVVAVLLRRQRQDVGVGDLRPGGDLAQVVGLVAGAEPLELGRRREQPDLAVAAEEAGDVLDVAAQGEAGALGDDDLDRQDADRLPELGGRGDLGGGGGDPAAPGDGADAGRRGGDLVVDEDDVVRQLVAVDLLDLRGRRVVLEGGRPRAGPVEVLVELLDDVLPEVVEDAAHADPGVLAGPTDERVHPEPQGADLGLRGELGDGLELAVGLGVVQLVVGLGAGVEALGQPGDDVDGGGQLLDRPAVGVLRGDVVDAVEVVAVVVVRDQVRGAEAGDDRPHRVVGEVVVGAGPAVGREGRR